MSNFKARLDALSPERLRGMRRGIEKESLRAHARRRAGPDAASGGARLGADPSAHHHRLQRIAARADHRRACARRVLPGRADAHPPVHLPRARRRDAVGRPACRAGCRPTRRSRSAATARRTSAAPRASTAWAWRTATAGACRRSRASTTTGRMPGVHERAVLRADPQLPPPRVPAAVPVRRLAGACARASSTGRAARAAAAGRGHACTCRTPPRCAWGGWATRATRRPALAVSYNSLDSYAASLQDALTRPYPAYEAIGVAQPGRRVQPARDQPAADRERVLRHDPAQARDPPGRAAAACAARARRRVRRGALHGPRPVRAGRHRRRRRCASSTSSCCTACCRQPARHAARRSPRWRATSTARPPAGASRACGSSAAAREVA